MVLFRYFFFRDFFLSTKFFGAKIEKVNLSNPYSPPPPPPPPTHTHMPYEKELVSKGFFFSFPL